MSFSEHIKAVVDSHVDAFIEKIATTYTIDRKTLRSMWDGDVKPTTDAKVPKPVQEHTPAPMKSSEDLNKLSKPEIVSLCKIRGIKVTGTKQELVERLTGDKLTDKAKPSEKKTSTAGTASEKQVLKMMQTRIPTIQLKKNEFGFFEHSDTKLVFDRLTNTVIGKQNTSGNVNPITEEDIEICNKYNFKYTIPTNLISDKKIVIEGLEDEILEDQIGETLEEDGEEYEEEYDEEEEVEEEYDD